MAEGKAGRKAKYDNLVAPHLAEINAAVMRGCTEEQIAHTLGISIASLNNYKKKYPELAEALSRNKGAIALQKLVNAGIEAACGKWVEETTTTVALDEDNKPTKKQQTTIRKYIPPNPTLHLFYVKMYGKDEGFASDPLELELKKQKFELDKAVQSLKDWHNYDDDLTDNKGKK